MTLVVEDGNGLADAESYVSAADATDHVNKWRDSADWNGASEADKERALRRATRFVNAHRFIGFRAFEKQALDWPRAHVGYVDGQEIFSDQVPRRIREATIEAAIRDIEGDDLLTDHDSGTVRRLSQQVGSLSQTTEFAAPRKAGRQYEAINALLKPFLARGKLERSIA